MLQETIVEGNNNSEVNAGNNNSKVALVKVRTKGKFNIKQYAQDAKLLDHVSRDMSLTNNTFFKHHAIIIKIDLDNIMNSLVVHVATKKRLFKVETLEKFMAGHSELYVYDHDKEDLLGEEEINNNIKKALQKEKTNYSFFSHNCEDIIIDIILTKKYKKYIKQNSYYAMFKFCYKSALLGIVACAGSFYLVGAALFVHFGFKPKRFDIDPLDMSDKVITDPNKKRTYIVKDKKPLHPVRIAAVVVFGALAFTCIKTLHKAKSLKKT